MRIKISAVKKHDIPECKMIYVYDNHSSTKKLCLQRILSGTGLTFIESRYVGTVFYNSPAFYYGVRCGSNDIGDDQTLIIKKIEPGT